MNDIEIGTLEWYKWLQHNYSVSTVSTTNYTTVLLIVEGVGYTIDKKELDKYRSNWNIIKYD